MAEDGQLQATSQGLIRPQSSRPTHPIYAGPITTRMCAVSQTNTSDAYESRATNNQRRYDGPRPLYRGSPGPLVSRGEIEEFGPQRTDRLITTSDLSTRNQRHWTAPAGENGPSTSGILPATDCVKVPIRFLSALELADMTGNVSIDKLVPCETSPPLQPGSTGIHGRYRHYAFNSTVNHLTDFSRLI